jgi:hypothetical protein
MARQSARATFRTATVHRARLHDRERPLRWKLRQNWLRRNLIQQAPGSGPVRGGFVFNGVVYVVRDNVGATAASSTRPRRPGGSRRASANLVFKLGLVEIA